MGCFLCTQSHPNDSIVIGKADDVAAAKLAVHSSGRVQGYRFGRMALPVLAYGTNSSLLFICQNPRRHWRRAAG
jgi:hypothetical protein